jgi:hypothetical protein
MGVVAVARPSSMRDIRWPVWALLALAAVVMAHSFMQAGPHLSIVTFAAPLLFAAAVVYLAPPDKRFVWAAVLIAIQPAVVVITAWLPDFWFDTVPGDWKNATPLLMDLGSAAVQIARVLEFIGLALLGLAMGGVRTRASAAIIGAGVLFAVLAVADSIQFLTSQEGLPIDMTVRSIAFPPLNILLWAFVFAAALESRRMLMAAGTGLLFALIGFDRLQDWWLALPSGPLDALVLVTGMISVIGWALVILSPLRGELSGAPSGTTGDL